MLVQGSVYPDKIWIKYIDKDNNTIVRLRRNVQKKIKEENNKESSTVFYEYEEVEISIINRENIQQIIEKNFDLWFEEGLKIEKLKNINKEKNKQMYVLIDKKVLIDLDKNSKTGTMLLTSLMSEMDILKNEIKILKEKVGV